MLQDQSRNRTPMPGAQAPAATPPDTGPARAEAGIAAMLAEPSTSDETPAAPPADLPAPGSPEAMAAFSAACRGVDGASFIDEAEAEALKIGSGLQYWTSDVVSQAQAGSFTRILPQDVEAAKATPADRLGELLVLTLRRELRIAEATRDTRLRQLFVLAYPDEQEEATDTAPAGDAVDLAIEAHRAARAALTAACNPADEVFVEQNGGDTSDAAMAPARAARDAASDAETDAWDALLEVRPSDTDGLLRMLRYLAGAGPMEVLGDAREFGRNIAEAAEAALRPAIDADAELIALGRQHDALHAAWRQAENAGRALFDLRDAAISEAEARGVPTVTAYEVGWALPGVQAAYDAAQDAFEAMEPVCRAIARRPASTITGIAVKARATISAVWAHGGFERDAAQGTSENWDAQMVRQLIEACSALVGIDWQGKPIGAAKAETQEAAVLLDSASVKLLQDLEECDRQKDALTEKDYDTPKDEELYKRHWDLREKIDELLSASPLCLRVKARTALFALKWDPDAENEGTGSFVSLAKQVVTGIGERPLVNATESSSLTDQILDAWRAWGARPDLDESDVGQAEFDRLNDLRNTLIDIVDRLPATPENILPKALGSAWIEYVHLWQHGNAREDYSTDGRLALDIDTAICGRLKTRHAGVAA